MYTKNIQCVQLVYSMVRHAQSQQYWKSYTIKMNEDSIHEARYQFEKYFIVLCYSVIH